MTAGPLAAFLRRHRHIALDSSVFSYQLEGTTRYRPAVFDIFARVEGPRGDAVTSTVTMTELLVAPYRAADLDRVNAFFALLSTFPHLAWCRRHSRSPIVPRAPGGLQHPHTRRDSGGHRTC